MEPHTPERICEHGHDIPEWCSQCCKRYQKPASGEPAPLGTVPSEPKPCAASDCSRLVVGRKANADFCTDKCKRRHQALNGPRHGRRRKQEGTAIRLQILGLLHDGRRWTAWQLAEACGCMETSASSKARDLRKPQYGGFKVRSQRRPGHPEFEYWLEKEDPA